MSDDDAKARVDDLELQAALQRAGLWSKTDPAKLAAMREARREERRELESEFNVRPDQPVNLNTATIEEIMNLPGVGEVLAERIVDGRPYRSVEDLRRVPGMGGKILERIKSLVTAAP